ncbi:uncharacterized protein LOC143925339 [Lithobates pipiens]
MTVGIFSRDDPTNYKWLTDFLCTFVRAGDVTPVLISNWSKIEPQKYTFTNLYHSRTRGRINVTDVTDALYNNELETLYKTLGKRKVIVVIDDLDNNSDEEKTRILMAQPTIHRMAHELFLFPPGAKLDNDTNHVNISNKRRIREIIQAARPPRSSSNTDCTISCGLRMKLVVIAIVLLLYSLAIILYNKWFLQW